MFKFKEFLESHLNCWITNFLVIIIGCIFFGLQDQLVHMSSFWDNKCVRRWIAQAWVAAVTFKLYSTHFRNLDHLFFLCVIMKKKNVFYIFSQNYYEWSSTFPERKKRRNDPKLRIKKKLGCNHAMVVENTLTTAITAQVLQNIAC